MLASKRPWAVYTSTNYDDALKIIRDSSGNARASATTSNVQYVVDSTFRAPILAGSTTSTILFPTGSLPINYTIASVARYKPGGTLNRIIASPTINFTHSHFNGFNALFYNDATTMSSFSTNIGSNTKWCVSISTNMASIAAPNQCSLNGQYIGLGSGLKGPMAANASLCINLSGYNTQGQFAATPSNQSDFQFYSLVIYDQALTVAEMTYLSGRLGQYIV